MHVERYGHGGAPVLLVHGFGTCAFLWRNIGPEIALANRTAFAIDMFGYGESDRPFDAAFGIAAQSEYLDRALTALRLPKATVVGVDLGAAVALHLAATRPDRVERLILVNPIALDEVPANDVKTMHRNTARFALRVSRGVLGAAPLMTELLRGSVAREESMPDPLVARYLAPYVGRDGLEHLLMLGRSITDDDKSGGGAFGDLSVGTQQQVESLLFTLDPAEEDDVAWSLLKREARRKPGRLGVAQRVDAAHMIAVVVRD